MGPALVHTADDNRVLPELWRAALLQLLPAKARAAVAQTCNGALRWLLEDRPHVAVSVPVKETHHTSPEQPTTYTQKLPAWLTMRGKQTTTLTVTQRAHTHTDTLVWWQGWAGDTQLPCKLTLSLQLPHIPAALLSAAGHTFPALTTLSLGVLHDGCSVVHLPPAADLPALRQMTIWGVSAGELDRVWANIPPYLLRLTSLAIKLRSDGESDGESTATDAPAVEGAEEPAWAFLCAQALRMVRSTTLVRLEVPYDLEPWLVRLLQGHLPALRDLGVCTIAEAWEDDALSLAPVCTWNVLRLSMPGRHKGRDQRYLGLDMATWVPLPAAKKLPLDMPKIAILQMYLPILPEVSAVCIVRAVGTVFYSCTPHIDPLLCTQTRDMCQTSGGVTCLFACALNVVFVFARDPCSAHVVLPCVLCVSGAVYCLLKTYCAMSASHRICVCVFMYACRACIGIRVFPLQVAAMLARVNLRGTKEFVLVHVEDPDDQDEAGIWERHRELCEALTHLAPFRTKHLQLVLHRCFVTADLAARLTEVAGRWKTIRLSEPEWTDEVPEQGVKLPHLVNLQCCLLDDSEVEQVRVAVIVCVRVVLATLDY